jgi:hypothetical protein
MTVKTFFLKDVAVSGFGSLSEVDPGASTMVSGLVVGKIAAAANFKLQYGTEGHRPSAQPPLTTARPSGGR